MFNINSNTRYSLLEIIEDVQGVQEKVVDLMYSHNFFMINTEYPLNVTLFPSLGTL